MSYSRRQLILIISKITLGSTVMSLVITLAIFWLTRMPLMAVPIILAIVIPLIVAPATSFFTVRALLQIETLKRELERISSTDELTSLYNRRFFLSHARQQLASPQRAEACLLLLDVDQFKRINDTYGHDVGDDALRGCALVLQQTVRTVDVLARFGGEEFVVFLPDTPLDQATFIAERVRQRVEKTPLTLDGQQIKMTLSVGCASSQQTSDLTSLIREADRALYVAKHNGRNRVEVATHTARLGLV